MRLLARPALMSLLAYSAVLGHAQGGAVLTLEEALKMARTNNGTVRSAFLAYESAQAGTRGAKAEFLPTVTPSATQEFGRSETYTGLLRRRTNIDDLTSQVDVAWRLFDSGGRKLALDQAKAQQDSSELTALQTLRRTLFDVHSRFYEALRRQELLRVQDRQVERTGVIFEQTKFRATDEIGDAPRKDIKQAEADLLNAQVSQLTARTRISTALADLKAVIASGPGDLPALETPQRGELQNLDFTLEQAFEEGMKNRADLASTRRRVDVDRTRLRIAKLDGGPRWSVDANYRRFFSEDASDRAALSFNISYPLYDGARTKEAVKAQELTVKASLASLTQSELEARAEIESAYKEYGDNLLRLRAATKALEAAQENYRFAVESQKEGAANLVEVLTAQVTLTTAESNLVEAQYDAILSEIRLRLSLGRPMPGEQE